METNQLFIWIMIGGLLYVLLSYGTFKFKNNQKSLTTHYTSYIQDFISGAIVITLASFIMPSLFPHLSVPSYICTLSLPTMFMKGGNTQPLDIDEVQVKLPELTINSPTPPANSEYLL